MSPLRRASRRPAAARAGFTLLEIIVVILIIGIMATFATLTIGGRSSEDRLQAEAQRLEKLMSLAADEALFRGEQLGLLVEVHGYRILTLGEQGWAPYSGGAALRAHPVPEPMRMTLSVEGRPTPPHDPEQAAADADADEDDQDRDADGSAMPPPQVMVLSSGEMTPFTLDFSVPGQPARYRVEADLMGRVRSGRLDEDGRLAP